MGFLFVGLGGALGAVLRYAISLIPHKGTFPILTLITNVCGAVLIGYVAGIAVGKQLSPNLVLFLKTGSAGALQHFPHFRWRHLHCHRMEMDYRRDCTPY